MSRIFLFNCDVGMVSIDIGAGPLKKADLALDITPTVTTGIVADALHLPFRNGSIRFVYSAHCIEHVKDPFLMLSEIRRVLSAEGVFEVRYPRLKYINVLKYFLWWYFILQLPFIEFGRIILLFKYIYRWGKQEPRGYHKFWIHPSVFSDYFQVESISLGSGGSPMCWKFLQSMGGRYRGRLAKWLSHVLPYDPMELIIRGRSLPPSRS